jgi:hypothetical protein
VSLRRIVAMEQFRLFPPSGVITRPLPHEALREARRLLAELLAAIVEPSTPAASSQGGDADE